MKFKGQTIRGPLRQYSLRQQLGEGGFSVIYNTTDPQTICKVQVLSNPDIYTAYKNQKQALQQFQHKNIVQLKDAFEIKDKDGYFGFLLMENCNAGNAWNILDKHGESDVAQNLVLRIAYSVASALQYMHKKNITHRDIKLQNMLINSKGEYKLCDFGSSSKQKIKIITKQNRQDIQQHIDKTTTPLYRAPQQLDLYSGFQIGSKVDIFALGVFMFMLCFKKPAFESRLSAINKQYFVPQETSYSSHLVQLIEKCFTTDPAQRINATQAKLLIKQLLQRKVAQVQINIEKQIDATSSQILKITNQMLKKNSPVAESSIFDKIKLMYNQITTQTQGWVASFIEDNEQAPQLKYNRSIISKCWEKRYKTQKVFEILFKYSEDYKTKSLVNLKLLILVHNFLRKGPPESINCESKFSVSKLCAKIYKNWKMSQRSTDPEDIKRNSYVCLLIRYYSLILLAKWKICYEYSELIEGNFSILPFLQSKKQAPLLKLPLITSLIQFLDICASFHQVLTTRSYLIEVQRSIILSLVDEEYCCLSLLVFLISSFKQAICHISDEVDIEKLSQTLKYVERDFEQVFKKLSKLFQSANKLAYLFEEQTNFSLSPKILDRIKAINIRLKKPGSFQFTKHINYDRNIEGLKIPLSYQEAVKNPDFLKSLEKKEETTVLEMNQFKIKKTCDLNSTQKQISNQYLAQKQTQINPNEAFKRNKQNNCTVAEVVPSTNVGSTKNIVIDPNNEMKQKGIEIYQPQKPINASQMMQFSHQNLNRDMKSSAKKNGQKIQANPSKFDDFLSIVDGKFNQVQSKPPLQQKDGAKQVFQNIVVQKQQKNRQIFSNFTSMVNSNISSLNSQNPWNRKLQEKDIFHNSFQSLSGTSKQKKFQEFGKFVAEEQSAKSKTPVQVTKTLTQQFKSLSSSISQVTKEVYESLNSNLNEEKRVELMNFFDEDQSPAQTNDSKPPILASQIPNNTDFLNKTSLAKPRSNEQLFDFNTNFQPNLNKNHNQSKQILKHDSDQKHFKTMPCDHSFIDLKGFIVEQVKKNAEQYFIEFSTLKFFKKVGFGHSSQVFKGQWRGRQVAIKCIKDNMSPSSAKQFKRQIMTSVKIRHHPNLVTLIGIAEYQNQYYIINEFCNGATLFDFLHESNHNVSIKVKLSIAKQIARGMLFLHTNDPPIIHRDLKSLNVLLVNKYNGESQPQIKIADFGLSRDFASTYMTGTLGTYVNNFFMQHWMAPEIFNNEPYSLKADVYSYGIVLWEILSQTPPYTNLKNPQSLMKFITVENGRPDLNFITEDCPSQIKSLMIRCWDQFQQNRPSFKEILDTLNHFN